LAEAPIPTMGNGSVIELFFGSMFELAILGFFICDMGVFS